jgi:hypothetical protein
VNHDGHKGGAAGHHYHCKPRIKQTATVELFLLCTDFPLNTVLVQCVPCIFLLRSHTVLICTKISQFTLNMMIDWVQSNVGYMTS